MIYFNENEWIELSRLLWEDRVETAKAAVKEAVIPLMAEVEVLKKQARANRLYKWGFWGAVGVAAAATVWAAIK